MEMSQQVSLLTEGHRLNGNVQVFYINNATVHDNGLIDDSFQENSLTLLDSVHVPLI